MNEEYLEDYEDEELYYAVRPNKTQIKRDIAVIFKMAEEMTELSAEHLANLELPENILLAVNEAARLPHKGARKRQLKYVTAQLRKIELDEIQEKLARLKNRSAHAVREHHQAERWRDRLIADTGNEVMTQLLSEFPSADTQQLRQLQRNAKKELAAEKPPKSARLLYQYLKKLLEQAEPDG